MKKPDALKLNEVKTPLIDFLESYNRSIPAGFPRPSAEILRTFQELHPALFKNTNEWSIDKHRKRLMDWLPSYYARKPTEKRV